MKSASGQDILREFLTKHKAEVRTVSIFEYDQEKHIKLVQKKLLRGKTPAQIADELEEEQSRNRGVD